ncbi:MAG: hypothetical protein JWP52_3958, partial [Rhizobacter sp.]|nr:hypothetical protein [Rhizobacter sp.]
MAVAGPASPRRPWTRTRNRASISPRPWASRSNAVAFAGLLLLLAWAPVPLGSNRPWALSVLAIGLSGLLLLVSISAPREVATRLRTAVLPLSLLAACAGVLVLQCLPLPLPLLRLLVPDAVSAGSVSES